MRARVAEGYAPDFDLDLRHGKAIERTVAAFIDGFTNGTVEVKSDRLAVETGNVYIEDECKRRDGWQSSGIVTTKADYWALVIGECVVLGIPTVVLRHCYEKALDPHLRMRRKETDGTHPTRGVAIPLNVLFTWIRIELHKRADAA